MVGSDLSQRHIRIIAARYAIEASRELFTYILSFLCCPFSVKSRAEAFKTQFEALSPHVGIFHEAINVAVIQRNGKSLLIGSGDGAVLEAAKKLGIGSIEWVLYIPITIATNVRARPLLKKAGVKIAVPAGEAEFFKNATEFGKAPDTFSTTE